MGVYTDLTVLTFEMFLKMILQNEFFFGGGGVMLCLSTLSLCTGTLACCCHSGKRAC